MTSVTMLAAARAYDVVGSDREIVFSTHFSREMMLLCQLDLTSREKMTGGIMAVRQSTLLSVMLVVVCAAAQQNPIADKTQLPPTYVPSGKTMYKQYCAACHGADGKGRGPAAASLNTRPSDLTTLANVMAANSRTTP
jgi:mono/diheme cytochrome c family protein